MLYLGASGYLPPDLRGALENGSPRSAEDNRLRECSARSTKLQTFNLFLPLRVYFYVSSTRVLDSATLELNRQS